MIRPILEKINTANPLLTLTEAGFTPDQIKTLVVETLGPFFKNQAILRELAVEFLAPEAANVGRLLILPKGVQFLNNALSQYHAAYADNTDQAFRIIAFWERRMEQAVRDFWVQALTEVTKDDLPLEFFQHECFRNIGGMIEGCIQPLLREQLSLQNLIMGSPDPFAEASSLTFGTVVGKLLETFPDPDLLAPEPWKITLSQWRNIAQHRTARVEGNHIVAEYGRYPNTRRVTLQRSELLEALIAIQARMAVLRAARTIFLFDHFEEAKAHLPKVEIDASSKLFQLSCAFATQGFRVERVDVNNREVSFALRDMASNGEPKRTAHCSQFFVSVWLYYRTDMVRIEYIGTDGRIKIPMYSTGAELADVTADAKIDFDRLAGAIHFPNLGSQT